MKLKMYLRGLGAGIIFATIIMGILGKSNSDTDAAGYAQTADNATLVESAADAALTEDSSNTDIDSAEENSVTDKAAAEESTGTDIALKDISIEADAAATVKSGAQASTGNSIATRSEEAGSNVAETAVENGEKYVVDNSTGSAEGRIIISSGDSSDSVSHKLFEAGYIDSETKFNDYLIKNGYDRRIRVGEKNIPQGSDYKKIAEIITG